MKYPEGHKSRSVVAMPLTSVHKGDKGGQQGEGQGGWGMGPCRAGQI